MNSNINEDEIVLMTINPGNIFVPYAFMTEEDAKYFIDHHEWFQKLCKDFSHVLEFDCQIRVMGSDVHKTFQEKVESIKKYVPELQVYIPPKSTRN